MDADVVSGRSFRSRVRAYRDGRDFGPRCSTQREIEQRLREISRDLRLSWHFDGVADGAGCWAVWKLTPRYVPQGMWRGLSFTMAQDVPQLIMRVKPEFLTLDVVQAIKEGDLWGKDREKFVDSIEAQERQVHVDVNRKAADVYREEWNNWWLQDTPHSFVPGDYKS